jgi:hypothetical protein
MLNGVIGTVYVYGVFLLALMIMGAALGHETSRMLFIFYVFVWWNVVGLALLIWEMIR